jgi:predicted membrane protein
MKLSTPQSSWPKYLRRGPMEMVACVIIAIGIVMMLQPLALILFTWSFVTTLFGTLLFTVVTKFPE